MYKIDNPLKVEIKKTKIYNDIYDYSVEDGYYFESHGTSYGQHIFGSDDLMNYYVIKKKEDKKDEKDK